MKNKCHALKKIVRRELNDAASSNPTASIRDLTDNPSGQSASFHGQSSNPFGLTAGAFAPTASFHDPSADSLGLSCWSIIATSGSFGVSAESFGIAAGVSGTAETSYFLGFHRFFTFFEHFTPFDGSNM